MKRTIEKMQFFRVIRIWIDGNYFYAHKIDAEVALNILLQTKRTRRTKISTGFG